MIIQNYSDGLEKNYMDRLRSRFWEKVNKDGPTQNHCTDLGQCWEWVGAKNRGGRGLFRVGSSTSSAPRIAYELEIGPVSEDMIVMHKCDYPPCVRPSHVKLGTHKENSQDMVTKGRDPKHKLLKTHCPQGHLYTGEKDKRGSRFCRTCHNAHSAQSARRLRKALTEQTT